LFWQKVEKEKMGKAIYPAPLTEKGGQRSLEGKQNSNKAEAARKKQPTGE